MDHRPVKARFLLIVIAAFVIGASGKLAYDSDQEQERRKSLEESLSGDKCSFCTLVKEDMKRTREEVEMKRALEAQAE